MKKLTIAIDGPAGAGKSTIARKVAEQLGILYLDTGAMYRAVALFMIRQGIDLAASQLVEAASDNIDLDVALIEGEQHVFLDNEDVTAMIRTPEVSRGASQVAAVRTVRQCLVRIQKKIAAESSVVMDGRDIGTHVLTDATLKVYLTATVEERARRRWLELEKRGNNALSIQDVASEVAGRDHQDMSRQESPLRQAVDAVLLDTSSMSIDEVVAEIIRLVEVVHLG